MADRYWVGPLSNSALWNSTANWSASSGGASGASVPIAGDNVWVDKALTTTYYTINVNTSLPDNSTITLSNSDPTSVWTWYLTGSALATAGTAWAINTGVTVHVPDGKNGIFQNATTGTGTITKTGGGGFGTANTATRWGSNPINLQGGTLTVQPTTTNKLGTGTITMAAGTGITFTTSLTSSTLNNPLVVNGNIKLNANDTGLAGDLNGATGVITFTAGVTLNGAYTLTIGGVGGAASNSVVISGAVSGTAGFTKAGTGTLTLGNANASLSGAVTVSAGTLTNTATASLTSCPITLTGGTYQVGVASTVIPSISGTSGTFDVANSVTFGSDNTDQTFSGVISGAGAMTKTGTGKQTLSPSSSTYSGAVTISNGTLYTLNDANASLGAVTVAGAGTWAAYSPDRPTRATLAGGLTLNNGATIVFGAP